MVDVLNDRKVSLSKKELATLTRAQRQAYSMLYFPHTWQEVIQVFRWLVETRRKLAYVKEGNGKLHRQINKLKAEHDSLKSRCSVAMASAVEAQELLRRIR